MKTPCPSIALALALSVLPATLATAQNGPARPGGGGFPRPLAEAPRTGNPGASPQLSAADFKVLVDHWADFDADKDKQLSKSEVPELFVVLFEQADLNHDGKLDEKERAQVVASAPQPPPVARQAMGPRRGPPGRPGPVRPPPPAHPLPPSSNPTPH